MVDPVAPPPGAGGLYPVGIFKLARVIACFAEPRTISLFLDRGKRYDLRR